MKTSLISFMLAITFHLAACTHQSKDHVSQPSKTRASETSDKDENLVWRCPTVSYERHNPDGTIDSWGICGVEIGDITVRQHMGAIIPLGELTLSEDIPPKAFSSYPLGETYQSGPIKFVNYTPANDPSSVKAAYEVLFPDCAFDNFTLFVNDQNQDGALDALHYVFNKMRVGSQCNLN